MSPLRRFLQIIFALIIVIYSDEKIASLSDDTLLELGDELDLVNNREQLRTLEGST